MGARDDEEAVAPRKVRAGSFFRCCETGIAEDLPNNGLANDPIDLILHFCAILA